VYAGRNEKCESNEKCDFGHELVSLADGAEVGNQTLATLCSTSSDCRSDRHRVSSRPEYRSGLARNPVVLEQIVTRIEEKG